MSWLDVPADSGFGLDNLPLGIFSTSGTEPRTGVRIGDVVLDLWAFSHEHEHRTGSLNAFLARGPEAWRRLRVGLQDALTDEAYRSGTEPFLVPVGDVAMHLLFEVADYVDFYSSRAHAENVGRMFRPDADPLTPNWTHLPIGYHGRAGTVRVSGTPVVRPSGQRRAAGDDAPTFGPSGRLDIEAEVGFVVGIGSELGTPVRVGNFPDHVFGVCLVNDWSARDLQSWEYVPLGPFLGKSFATSVSAWVTPLEALDAARTAPPTRDAELLPYLEDADDEEPGGFDIRISVEINGRTVSEPPFASMYWTAAQQLAQMTVNGASLRTGDLYGSGTVSGPEPGQRGSLLALTWNGRAPLDLAEGRRTFLEDGDTVTLTAWAPGPHGTRVGLGEVIGRITASP